MITPAHSGLKKRGLINDCISDMLTRIRNATLAKKSIVLIPCTQLNLQIAQILEKEGFIQNFQISTIGGAPQKKNAPWPGGYAPLETLWSPTNKSSELQEILIRLKYRSKTIYNGKTKESCITNLKRLSKPGLRIYTNYKEIPRILGGTGLVILSTPQGLLTDREARSQKIGGEVLCFIW